jgi:hypothetical protein
MNNAPNRDAAVKLVRDFADTGEAPAEQSK